MERGICPIAPLVLHLTLYSLTGSRVWPIGSHDVIGHVTIGTADGRFLLVIHWHHIPISHRCWDIKRNNWDNHIPIVNTLETNLEDFFSGGGEGRDCAILQWYLFTNNSINKDAAQIAEFIYCIHSIPAMSFY